MNIRDRLLKSPALHFLVIGALLFVMHQGWLAYSFRHKPMAREELVITREQINQIKNDIQTQTGVRATPAQIESAVEQAIEDEILYRQALALHLDRNNPSIRHRLVQLARFVSEDPKVSDGAHYRKALELGLERSDPVIRRYLISLMRLVAKKVPTPQAPARVSQEEMETYLEQHPQSFMKPPQIKFTHLYFSRDKRGLQAGRQAKLLLNQLQKDGKHPNEALGRGDPFLAGNDFAWVDDSALRRWFGPAFAKNLAGLEVGKWLGPLPSSYGWHLVFVEGARPARAPALAEVFPQVKGAILKEREERRLRDNLQELRSRYSIRVEGWGGDAYSQI